MANTKFNPKFGCLNETANLDLTEWLASKDSLGRNTRESKRRGGRYAVVTMCMRQVRGGRLIRGVLSSGRLVTRFESRYD